MFIVAHGSDGRQLICNTAYSRYRRFAFMCVPDALLRLGTEVLRTRQGLVSTSYLRAVGAALLFGIDLHHNLP